MSFIPGNHKTISIAFPDEEYYQVCMLDQAKFRSHLDQTYRQHPELFPTAFTGGYILHGFVYSTKQDIKTRRIKLLEDNEAYQIRPSFLMPYMIARADEVEKGLYFKRWGVPFEALAYGFGHDAMFWYRAYVSMYDGQRNSPFEALNGFRYHHNWLHNLLIASSLQGQSFQTQNPL